MFQMKRLLVVLVFVWGFCLWHVYVSQVEAYDLRPYRVPPIATLRCHKATAAFEWVSPRLHCHFRRGWKPQMFLPRCPWYNNSFLRKSMWTWLVFKANDDVPSTLSTACIRNVLGFAICNVVSRFHCLYSNAGGPLIFSSLFRKFRLLWIAETYCICGCCSTRTWRGESCMFFIGAPS